MNKLRRFWKRWWITVFDVDECAEWLRWKNFDEVASEETERKITSQCLDGVVRSW
jgi:hypothetical protein